MLHPMGYEFFMGLLSSRLGAGPPTILKNTADFSGLFSRIWGVWKGYGGGRGTTAGGWATDCVCGSFVAPAWSGGWLGGDGQVVWMVLAVGAAGVTGCEPPGREVTYGSGHGS